MKLLNDTELAEAIEKTPAPRVTKESIDRRIKSVNYYPLEGTTVTICHIELDNGFSVRGESACVDPANYVREIGERIAFDNAYRQLWPLFGFALAETRMVNPAVPAAYKAEVVMRAKLKLISVDQHPAPFAVEYENLRFEAVGRNSAYPEDGLDEDNSFARFTPTATLHMTVNNPALREKFKAGQTFYVDFTEAQPQGSADETEEQATAA